MQNFIENTHLVTDNGRGHSVICDLPESQGGTNSGPISAGVGCNVACWLRRQSSMQMFVRTAKSTPETIEVNVEAQKTPDFTNTHRRNHESKH